MFQSDAAEMFIMELCTSGRIHSGRKGHMNFRCISEDAWLNQFPDRPGNYPREDLWREIKKYGEIL